MSYLAFARKYRPQTFSEVVGQDESVAALSKALQEDRLHHAYIFSGTRGVGKTTLARIMAKSLNCLSSDKPTLSPCGTCASCMDIQQGKSIDVIEIDGASNTGVDNIRELRESVKFAPSYGRYKVYIIDEVHRISQQAFDALLKTLEEPPSHVKFIFATTELNKVPITILSRCQKFNFNLVAKDNIIKKLKHIAEKESIDAPDEIYRYIAKASLGSIRDAESIFDQITPMIMDGADFDSILDILGEIKEFALLDFIETLVKKDAPGALRLIDSVLKQGKDLEKFLDNIIDLLRNVMLMKLLKDSADTFVDVPLDVKEKIAGLAAATDAGFIVRAIDSLIEVKRVSRYIESMRIPFEVAVVRLMYARPQQASKPTGAQPRQQAQAQSRPSVAPQARSQVQTPAPKPVAPKPVATPPPAVKPAVSSQAEPSASATSATADELAGVFDSFKSNRPVKKVENTVQVSSRTALTIEQVTGIWPNVLSEVAKTRTMLSNNLSIAKIISVNGSVLTLGFPKNCAFQKESLERPNNKTLIAGILKSFLSVDITLNTILIDEELERPPVKDEARGFVNDVLDAFDGEII